MPTRELLSPAQRAQFTTLPDPMSERDLARHYTLYWTPRTAHRVGEDQVVYDYE